MRIRRGRENGLRVASKRRCAFGRGGHCIGFEGAMMGSSGEQKKSKRRWSIWAMLGVVLAFGSISFVEPSTARADDMFKKGPNGQYEIQTSVWFPSNAKRFRPRYRSRLKKIAAFLKKHPEITLVQLIGHADSRGNVALNQRLSGVRARYVKDTLVGMGVKAERLQVVASGAEQSSYNNKNPRGRGMNRRVDFLLVYGDVPEPEAVAESTAVEQEQAEVEPDEGTQESGDVAEDGEGTDEESTEGDEDGDAEEAVAESGEAEEEAADDAVENETTEEPVEEAVEEPAEEVPEDEQPAEELVDEVEAEPAVEEEVDERIELPSWLDFIEPHVNVAVRSDMSHWVQDNPQWIAAGVTSAALLTALTLDAMSITRAISSSDYFEGSPDAVSNQEDHSDYRSGALIFYTIAAAGAAGSAWLYLDDYMSLFESEPETSIQLVPTEGGAMLNLQMPLLGD